MQVILLERVEKLGQMGDEVTRQGRLRPQLPAAQEEGAARHQGEPRLFPDPARRIWKPTT